MIPLGPDVAGSRLCPGPGFEPGPVHTRIRAAPGTLVRTRLSNLEYIWLLNSASGPRARLAGSIFCRKPIVNGPKTVLKVSGPSAPQFGTGFWSVHPRNTAKLGPKPTRSPTLGPEALLSNVIYWGPPWAEIRRLVAVALNHPSHWQLNRRR